MRLLPAFSRCLSQPCSPCVATTQPVVAHWTSAATSCLTSSICSSQASTSGSSRQHGHSIVTACSMCSSSRHAPCSSSSSSNSGDRSSATGRGRKGRHAVVVAAAGAADKAGTAPAAQQSAPAAKYSPLHVNIEEFCQRLSLSEDERRVRHEVIEVIRQCATRAFPELRGVKVELFGSFATGMSAWHSDIDLVITGLLEPDRTTGRYDIKDRGRVTARLRTLADQIRRSKKLELTRCSIISRARMPIIKLHTRKNVAVDISISDNTGVLAARYMTNQALVYPPLKPLTLVLKAYLRNQRLLDVATGGLSSYSLCNLVIAHLQEELKSGRDIFDLGEALYSFFLRYGEEFDYEVHAVSIRSGGIVPKRLLPFAMDSARFAASTQAYYDNAVSWHERLCVDCPVSGRDVSNGTYRIDVVRQALYRAARQLEALAKGRSISDTSINYLSALFDVQRVLKRMYIDEDPFFKVIGGPERSVAEERAGAAWRGRDATWDSVDEGEDWDLELEGEAGSDDGDDVLESEGSRLPKGRAARGR